MKRVKVTPSLNTRTMRKFISFFVLLFVGCEVQDFLYFTPCSADKIISTVEQDSVVSYGNLFFYGDTIRTDTLILYCEEAEILGVSRKLNAFYTLQDSIDGGIDINNIRGTPYKIFTFTEKIGLSYKQFIFAQGILPKDRIGFTSTITGEVYSRNPFLKNKRIITTDRVPLSQINRIHNTAKGMEKETSYPTGIRNLEQYSDNGLYYIAEENGLYWGIWIIGDVTPPKGDIS